MPKPGCRFCANAGTHLGFISLGSGNRCLGDTKEDDLVVVIGELVEERHWKVWSEECHQNGSQKGVTALFFFF